MLVAGSAPEKKVVIKKYKNVTNVIEIRVFRVLILCRSSTIVALEPRLLAMVRRSLLLMLTVSHRTVVLQRTTILHVLTRKHISA
jgi:hypothetical protein